jgi:hypothetical protein
MSTVEERESNCSVCLIFTFILSSIQRADNRTNKEKTRELTFESLQALERFIT